MSNVRALFHIVFTTKYRERSITPDKEEELYKYITGIIKNNKSYMLQINGMSDHIHLLIDLHPTISLSELVADVKRDSSKWIRDNSLFPKFRGWNEGYFAATCSVESSKNVINYIRNQKMHHAGRDFMDEIKDFYIRNGIEWDENAIRRWS